MEENKKLTVSLSEETKLLAQISEGGATKELAMARLCEINARFVVSVAKRHQNKGLSLDELIEAGNKGLAMACERYDASRGFKFVCYAVWWIRQTMLQAIKEKENLNDNNGKE